MIKIKNAKVYQEDQILGWISIMFKQLYSIMINK